MVYLVQGQFIKDGEMIFIIKKDSLFKRLRKLLCLQKINFIIYINIKLFVILVLGIS